MARAFGEIDGVSVGQSFANRQELHDAGVHLPLQAGISGAGREGADSVVVSGGYVDDADYGDVIKYTGHGGREASSRVQTFDQVLERGNLALAKNCLDGLPVRLIRGADPRSKFAPASGYRYDGLYRVTEYWSERGQDGHIVWRFLLEAIVPDRALLVGEPASQVVLRREVTTQRLVRNTLVAQRLKELYEYKCQFCGVQLVTPGGPYAEGAHIRPLGQPHNGPDVAANILCLCPNDHTLLDMGAIYINDSWYVVDRLSGERRDKVTIKADHELDVLQVQYQKRMFDES